jgi:uncharacterized membrane protein
MSKVEEIVEAVRALSDDDYVRLREALDEMDKAEWEAARAQAARDWAASGLTDDDIDAVVMRLRHEGRS